MTGQLYVIDDDEQYADAISALARELGWQVHKRTDAGKFLAQDLPCSGLLILDLVMPQVDGIEIIRALVESSSRADVVLISGFDDRMLDSAKHLCQGYGLRVRGCFTKPFRFSQLRNLLATELKSQSANSDEKISLTPAELEQAFLHGEIVPYFQPQVDSVSGSIVGCEALARWLHPRLGLLYPHEFLPLVAEANHADDLTVAIAEQTVQEAAILRSEGANISYAFNIGVQDITNRSLPEQLEQCCRKFQVKPAGVVLELPAGVACGELLDHSEVLTQLAECGFALAIEDHEGEAILQPENRARLAPFSQLKISAQHAPEIVSAVGGGATVIGACTDENHYPLIVSKVETEAQLTKVRGFDSVGVQGNFFAQPMPGNVFRHWCQQKSGS